MAEQSNLYFALREGFSASLDKPCLITPEGEQWSYGNIDELAARFAALLKSNGVTPGERVVVQVDKSPGAVALYLGTLRVGAIFVPLNTSYTANEVGYFLSDAEPHVFVSRPDDGLDEVVSSCGVSHHFRLGASSESGMWHDAQSMPPDFEIEPRKADDLAALVYTSGTTGRSKGAMISHGALVSNAITLHRVWGFEDDDVLLHALPIFHIHGLFVALHTAMLNASTMIFLDSFDAKTVRDQLTNATILMGVPTFYTRLMGEEGFGSKECEHVRLFISGSAPLTAQASEQWTELTGHRILERYGMTEAGMITSNPLDGERLPGTVGYALPGVEVSICDGDGSELPRGEVGNIEIRGPNLFDGYWRKPEKTTEEVRDSGFFITGDLGTMEEDGRVRIVGRAKDLIISGGYNIYPKEIESVLDDIDGVLESAVVGVPHKDVGEGVVAVIVAESEPVDQTKIQETLNENLARFKHPRRFYFVDALPRNAMGKVQKNLLCDQYANAYQ